jgi:3-methyladenine DNA glycosylase/8-oxoguanine DNA glycosylase
MTMLRLTPPRDYRLARDVCSYGYFLLAPNRWSIHEHTLTRAILLAGKPAGVVISQPGAKPMSGGGAALLCRFDRALTKQEIADARSQITRMLRLDEDAAHIRGFHRVDPRWKRLGRGRLFRSPTLFEDVLKTVTSCNVTWPGTVHMNRRLVEVLGKQSPGGLQTFPDPSAIAAASPLLLRERCRVGYRDRRIVELGAIFASGDPAIAKIEDPATSDDELHEILLELPGVGPYAAANIMQLLGRYSRLPLDTESVRHGRTILGFRGGSKQIMLRVKRHFEPFGDQAFRSYWFEMWHHYESIHGPAHTWDRDATGTAFTAAKLNAAIKNLAKKTKAKQASQAPKRAKTARANRASTGSSA